MFCSLSPVNDCHWEGLGPPAPAGHFAVPVDRQSHCKVLTFSFGAGLNFIGFLLQEFSKQDVPKAVKSNVKDGTKSCNVIGYAYYPRILLQIYIFWKLITEVDYSTHQLPDTAPAYPSCFASKLTFHCHPKQTPSNAHVDRGLRTCRCSVQVLASLKLVWSVTRAWPGRQREQVAESEKTNDRLSRNTEVQWTVSSKNLQSQAVFSLVSKAFGECICLCLLHSVMSHSRLPLNRWGKN